MLLVDAQPYDRSLSQELASAATVGLATLVRDRHTRIASAIVVDPGTGLSFLPFGEGARPEHAAQYLCSESMKRVMAEMNEYDLVVFDLRSEFAGDVLVISRWWCG